MTKSKHHHWHETLHAWYDKHGRRDLPWRNTDDAYAVYISEVMLQQTQVATVLNRFYHPFLTRFPTLQALAEAKEDDVLKAWEGLGYYSRARNLHRAAQISISQLPDDYNALIALPGIGNNTAHAILALGFRKPYAVMEANVKRVICRMHTLIAPSDKELWAHADAMLDRSNPFDYNQAMMDVGSLVCTLKTPQCDRCPLQTGCKGKAAPSSYPAPKTKKVTPVRRKAIIVLRDKNNRYHLTPRASRFLGGLYHFHETEADEKRVSFYGKELMLEQLDKLGSISHTYSHFKLQADVYLHPLPQAMNEAQWFTRKEIDILALSGAEHKVLQLIDAL